MTPAPAIVRRCPECAYRATARTLDAAILHLFVHVHVVHDEPREAQAS